MNERDLFTRSQRLSQFGFETYGDYIRSARWQEVKARYWASDLPKRCICGKLEGLLLHHRTYDRVCAERLTDLIPLCHGCHHLVHGLEDQGLLSLADPQTLVSPARAVENAARRERARQAREAEAQAERDRRASTHWILRLKAMRDEAKDRRIDIRSELRLVKRIGPHKPERLERVLAKIKRKLDGPDDLPDEMPELDERATFGTGFHFV